MEVWRYGDVFLGPLIEVAMLAVLADRTSAVTYIYENGVMRRGLWRSRTCFFHELGGLRIYDSIAYAHRNTNVYEFFGGPVPPSESLWHSFRTPELWSEFSLMGIPGWRRW